MSGTVTRGSVIRIFLRSFVIQGSWNYHTMIGSGFAFAILPALVDIFGSEEEDLEGPLRRHLEHFNAHPYLSSLALGAAVRLEADAEDEEAIKRFKLAVRGPLGSLGDALVWASWLPAVVLVALVLYWLGSPVWLVVSVFLVLYNAGHIGLRIWGFRTGLREGRRVGRHLGKASLGRWTERLRNSATLLLGLLAGLIVSSPGGMGEAGAAWIALGGVGFVAGAVIGHPVWRPASVLIVVAVALLATWGVVQ